MKWQLQNMAIQTPCCWQSVRWSYQLENGEEREHSESAAGYAVFGLQTVQVTWAIALGTCNLSPAKPLPIAQQFAKCSKRDWNVQCSVYFSDWA